MLTEYLQAAMRRAKYEILADDGSFYGEIPKHFRRNEIMAEQENTEIVKGIYEAFGRGDIPTILNSLADNIEWIVSGHEDGIPYAGTYRGREGVGQFFSVLGDNIEYSVFEPRE